MKKITHKCACGAEATFEDSLERKAWENGEESEGTYVVQVWAQDFLSAHAACRQANSKEEWETLRFNCEQCQSLSAKIRDAGRPARCTCTRCGTLYSLRRIEPKPDPDECADRRANRANSLGDDCFPTEEIAKSHCQWLARDRPGVFHFYPCNVGGKQHWHVEEMPADSIVQNLTSVPIIDLGKIASDARKAERERILKILEAQELKAHDCIHCRYYSATAIMLINDSIEESEGP